MYSKCVSSSPCTASNIVDCKLIFPHPSWYWDTLLKICVFIFAFIMPVLIITVCYGLMILRLKSVRMLSGSQVKKKLSSSLCLLSLSPVPLLSPPNHLLPTINSSFQMHFLIQPFSILLHLLNLHYNFLVLSFSFLLQSLVHFILFVCTSSCFLPLFPGTKLLTSFTQEKDRNLRRITRMVLVVVAVFIVCWTPIHIFVIITTLIDIPSSTLQTITWHFCIALGYTNRYTVVLNLLVLSLQELQFRPIILVIFKILFVCIVLRAFLFFLQ